MVPADGILMKDLHGLDHQLTRFNIHMMLLIGWISFISGIIVNIIYYADHPSVVEFSWHKIKNSFCSQRKTRIDEAIKQNLHFLLNTTATNEEDDDDSPAVSKRKIFNTFDKEIYGDNFTSRAHSEDYSPPWSRSQNIEEMEKSTNIETKLLYGYKETKI